MQGKSGPLDQASLAGANGAALVILITMLFREDR